MENPKEIDLSKFCEDYTAAMYMRAPWVKAGHRYATNGRIVVRVPAEELDTPAGLAPFAAADELFVDHFKRDGEFLPWPERRYCRQCYDAGVVMTEDMGWDDCLVCQGRPASGQILDAKDDPNAVIEVGAHWVAVRYDVLLRALPGLKYRAGVEDAQLPLPFVFDGGEGLLMGVRRAGETRVPRAKTSGVRA